MKHRPITTRRDLVRGEVEHDHLRRLVASFVDESGEIIHRTPTDLTALVGNALRIILSCSHGNEGSYSSASGAAAEWVGRAIDAETELDRFDTPDFLAQCSKTLLAEVAEHQADGPIKHTLPAGKLREALAGQASKWVPECADFTARGPAVLWADYLRDFDDDGADDAE